MLCGAVTRPGFVQRLYWQPSLALSLQQTHIRQKTQQAIEYPEQLPRGRSMSWWAPRVLLLAIVVVFATMGALFGLIYSEARSEDVGPADAIVVLGAAQFNGTPSAVFRARLDTAFDLYQRGAAGTIVVTGGRMAGDQFTEAEAGRNYLISEGVPPEAILMEHLSTDTAESMRRVGDLLQDQGNNSVLLVSDGFHLYRSKLLAEDNDLSAQTNDADSSPIRQGSSTEFQYMVREVFAVTAYYLGLD